MFLSRQEDEHLFFCILLIHQSSREEQLAEAAAKLKGTFEALLTRLVDTGSVEAGAAPQPVAAPSAPHLPPSPLTADLRSYHRARGAGAAGAGVTALVASTGPVTTLLASCVVGTGNYFWAVCSPALMSLCVRSAADAI